MNIEVDGVTYTNFLDASCVLRLDALSSSFSFTAVTPGAEQLPFKGGEACKVAVAGIVVLTGFIEVVQVNYASGSHTVTIQGRDKTADLLDSTIDRIDDIAGGELSLKALIEKVVAQLGSDIKVIDEVNPALFNVAEDIAAPEPGENAFSFIEKYARKRQVLLTSNGDGDIVIATNSGVNADGAIQHIIGAEDNNVLSSNFSFDTTGRFNAYRITSGLNPVALNQAGSADLSTVVNQGNGVFDSEIRPTRMLTLVSEVPFSAANCKNRAEWEANIRRARGLIYSATVPGFRVGLDTGDIWRINRLYQIVDDFVGKVEPMLCNAITFSIGADDGRKTSLGFVGSRAYTAFLTPDPLVVESTVGLSREEVLELLSQLE